MNILFVCTGNVCRSPMAEAFLRDEAKGRGLELNVKSTGTHAWAGRAATIDGRRTMNELGVTLDEHRTLVMSDRVVDWADLVIGLAWEHVRDTMKEYPSSQGKTFTLKELVALLPTLPPMDADPASWVSSIAAAREASGPIDDQDVDDPLGERRTAYMRVATEIQGLIAQLAEGFEAKGAGRRETA